ncbi:MAG: PAS domain-containing protein [Caldimicrobium sp.]
MKIQIKVEETLENTPFPAILITKDHRILLANKAFCEFLGKSFEEIKGKFCYEVVHSLEELPSFCPLCGKDFSISEELEKYALYCLYKKSAKCEKGFYTKEFFEPKLKKFLKVTLIPLYKEGKEEVFAYLHFIEDKTREYDIKEQLNLIIESFPELFFINDEHFNLLYANRVFKDLFKLELQEGKKCYELLYGRAKPCEGCPMTLPQEEGEDEVYFPKLGRFFKRIYKKITHPEGRFYKYTLYIDITEEIKNFEEAPIALAITSREG